MKHSCVNKRYWWVISASSFGLFLLLSHTWAADEGAFSVGPVTSEAMAKTKLSPMTETIEKQTLSEVLSSGGRSPLLQDVPTLSKRYSVGGTTLVPYVGAGFGSGYVSELDRSLNTAPSSVPSDSGLRSLFGQSLIPNEVQLGIRLPF